MIGAAYQRCRVHFLRNVFGVIPKDATEMDDWSLSLLAGCIHRL
jgi:transposase-like protein